MYAIAPYKIYIYIRVVFFRSLRVIFFFFAVVIFIIFYLVFSISIERIVDVVYIVFDTHAMCYALGEWHCQRNTLYIVISMMFYVFVLNYVNKTHTTDKKKK